MLPPRPAHRFADQRRRRPPNCEGNVPQSGILWNRTGCGPLSVPQNALAKPGGDASIVAP
jgi:hypothetical protein